MAEGAGFEPALGYSPKHAFPACDLNHSSPLPKRDEIITLGSVTFRIIFSYLIKVDTHINVVLLNLFTEHLLQYICFNNFITY